MVTVLFSKSPEAWGAAWVAKRRYATGLSAAGFEFPCQQVRLLSHFIFSVHALLVCLVQCFASFHFPAGLMTLMSFWLTKWVLVRLFSPFQCLGFCRLEFFSSEHSRLFISWESCSQHPALHELTFLYLSIFFWQNTQQIPGPFLVVVPLSTLANWAKEFRKWLPDMNIIVYVGTRASREVRN